MISSSNSVINTAAKNPTKRCWQVGSNTVVVIDKTIVKKLGLDDENDTFLEQEITADGHGILMRVRKIEIGEEAK